jgi:16S rRNA (guanine1207-N2)-methyltransferase
MSTIRAPPFSGRTFAPWTRPGSISCDEPALPRRRTEDQGLGREFIRAAARMLRKGGLCRLVANRHLAYEVVLRETFKQVTPLEEAGGFKVYEARR